MNLTMNKVLLTGRITKDPEIKYNANNVASVGFTLAVDKGVKDAQGNRQSDFISCVAFSSSADFISKYVKKGNMLAIVGHIATGSYQGQNGQLIYYTNVAVESVENLSPREHALAQPNYSNNDLPF